MITAAEEIGLRTLSEVFADRTYQDDGTLTPRSSENAMITDEAKSIAQVLRMVKENTVVSVSNSAIPILAETICLHGDGIHALPFAKKIAEILKEEGITVQSATW